MSAISALSALPGPNISASILPGLGISPRPRYPRLPIFAKRTATPRLTSREIAILGMMAKGKYSPEIALVLGLSEKTVDHHRASMRRKLSVTSPLAAFMQGVILGILSCPCQEPASTPAPRLTPREMQVLGLMARGCGSKDVARMLDIEVKTAETHRQNVLERLNVSSAIEAITAAMAHGIIDCPCALPWDYCGA